MRILLAVAVLIAGCGDPTGPDEHMMTGTWTSPQIDVLFGVTFDLKADGGTWRGTVAGHKAESGGIVTANSQTGDDVSLTMGPITPCGYGGYVLNMTLAGDRATGTATLADCNGKPVGYSVPVAVHRQ